MSKDPSTDDKIYPLTKKRREKLKSEGIFPYSPIGHGIISSSLSILAIFFIISFFYTEPSFLSIQTTSLQTNLLVSNLILAPLLVTSFIYLIHLFTGLILTRTIIKPFILSPSRNNRGRNSSLNIGSLIIAASSFLLLYAFFKRPGDLSILLNNLDILSSKLFFNNIIIKITILLFSFGILIIILNLIRFNLSNRMSKREIEAEAVEGEMSKAQKKVLSKLKS